jgi:hypothetical protein
VNGTMAPSGEEEASAGPDLVVPEARERRLPASTRSDATRIVVVIIVSRRRSRSERSRHCGLLPTALYYYRREHTRFY